MKDKRKKAALYALAAGGLWGTIGLYVRQLSGYGFTSLQLTVIRFIIAALFLGIWLCVKGPEAFRATRADLGRFFLTGVCCMLFFNICYAVTISKSTMATAAVLLYTSPVLVSILSVLIFKERPDLKKFFSAGLAIMGCAFISGLFSGQMKLSFDVLLWGTGAAFGYAMYSISASILLKRYSPETVLFYTFLMAGVSGIFICSPWEAVRIMADNPKILGIFILFSFFLQCSFLFLL